MVPARGPPATSVAQPLGAPGKLSNLPRGDTPGNMGVRVATTFATLGIAGLAASPGERSATSATPDMSRRMKELFLTASRWRMVSCALMSANYRARVCAALKSSLWPSQHPLSSCAITAMSYICHPREVEGEIGRSLIRLRPISSFDFELEAVGVWRATYHQGWYSCLGIATPTRHPPHMPFP